MGVDLLLAVIAVVVAFLLPYFAGRIGIIFFDHSIVIDGAWRILHGQVPYRDFSVPYGPLLFYLQALFFALCGMLSITTLLTAVWSTMEGLTHLALLGWLWACLGQGTPTTPTFPPWRKHVLMGTLWIALIVIGGHVVYQRLAWQYGFIASADRSFSPVQHHRKDVAP